MSESTIAARTIELADRFAQSIELDSTGLCKLDNSIYESSFEGGDAEFAQVAKIQKHNTTVVAALGKALGDRAEGFFKSNPEHDVAEVQLKAGSDTISQMVYKSTETPDGKGGSTTEYGKLVSGYRVSAVGDKTELKRVRSHISDMYTKAFGDTETAE